MQIKYCTKFGLKVTDNKKDRGQLFIAFQRCITRQKDIVL